MFAGVYLRERVQERYETVASGIEQSRLAYGFLQELVLIQQDTRHINEQLNEASHKGETDYRPDDSRAILDSVTDAQISHSLTAVLVGTLPDKRAEFQADGARINQELLAIQHEQSESFDVMLQAIEAGAIVYAQHGSDSKARVSQLQEKRVALLSQMQTQLRTAQVEIASLNRKAIEESQRQSKLEGPPSGDGYQRQLCTLRVWLGFGPRRKSVQNLNTERIVRIIGPQPSRELQASEHAHATPTSAVGAMAIMLNRSALCPVDSLSKLLCVGRTACFDQSA